MFHLIDRCLFADFRPSIRCTLVTELSACTGTNCSLRARSYTWSQAKPELVLTTSSHPTWKQPKLLGRQLTIVSREAGKSLRGHSEIRRLSYVDSILPGRDRVWIASGSADGWLPGDAALVRRGKTVITWGILSQVRDEVAILHLRTRINRSLALQPGDCVEQISVDDGGQVLSTRIARVEENNRVVLAGSRTNGWLVGQRLDISRDGEYVGFARIIAEEPLLIFAETVSAFQRLAPAVGDEVSVRPPAYKRCVRVGWVFRAERGYCLLTLGSHDGVIQGQNLYSHGNVHATFSAGSLYADHCGAEFTLDGGGESAEMPLWTMVSTERQMSGSPLLKPLPVAHPEISVVAPHSICRQTDIESR